MYFKKKIVTIHYEIVQFYFNNNNNNLSFFQKH